MSGVLHGIDQDVRFNHAAATELASGCRAAASALDNQAGPRASWVTHALTDFQGYYSELFRQNGTTQAGDATRLAAALRDVATKVEYLAGCAKAEQTRRETARAWKKRQDERGFWDHVSDWFTGGEEPPVGGPDPVQPQSVPAPTPPNRQPLQGSGSTGTSSARPANLRTFATNSAGANQELASRPGSLKTSYDTFVAGCGWGSLDASGVFTGFTQYLTANGNDVTWANAVAAAFEAAGGDGVVTLPNASITASLQAAGVDATRDDLVIDPTLMIGQPPTSGYADDPVNTATGNFLEREVDLRFAGGNAALEFRRMYNSLATRVGAFGPGWASWTEAGLAFSAEEARWTLDEGREVAFPRLGDGWGRATTQPFWLARSGEGYVVRDNAGGRWGFDAAGRLTVVGRAEGTRVHLEWDGGRLVAMRHERGRRVDLEWSDAGAGERVSAVVASDGRRVDYAYDDAGRLVSASGPQGTRTYRWDSVGLVDRITDADGVVEVLNTYDERGRVLTQLSSHGRESRFTYLPGRVTVVADADGNRSNTWIHDDRGRLVGAIDADGQRQSTAYDERGNPVLFTARDGRVTVVEHDDRSRMTARILPSGARLDFTHDDEDRLVSVTVENGDIVGTARYVYDGTGPNPVAIVDAEGHTTTLAWAGHLPVEVTDATGVTSTLSYDDHGDLVAIEDAAGHRATLDRDAVGRIVAATTPLGHRTTYTWAGELLASRTDPDGAVWHYEYSPAGRPVAVVDPLGHRTTWEHDDSGEGGVMTDALGRRTTRVLDDLGNLAAIELPDGTRWQYTHDALSRLVARTDPDGSTWRWEYDVNGAPAQVTDPTGRSALFTRSQDGTTTRATHVGGARPADVVVTDKVGRIVSVAQNGFGAHSTRYDRRGLPVEFVDPEGHVTAVERDAAGRPVSLRRPDGTVTRYAYDRLGRLASTTLPTGDTYSFSYDADGRLVEQRDPTGEAYQYAYDACGRIVETIKPGQGRATWTYDLCGRIVAVRDRMWGFRRYAYDAAGQLVSATNALGGVTRYTYDPLGRVTTTVDPAGDTWRRTYNALGKVTSQTDPLGQVERAGYDGAGRVQFNQFPGGRRIEYSYDGDGAISTVSVAGEVVARYERDAMDRTLTVHDRKDAAHPTTHRLRWDARGLLVERARGDRTVRWAWDANAQCSAITTPDGHTTSQVWDAAQRLVAVDHPVAGRVELTRDGAGRLLSATAPAATQTWTYEGGDVVAHRLSGDEGTATTTVERDAAGRVAVIVRDGVRTTYGYDEAGQLTSATTGDHRRTWAYDDGGRPVLQTDGAVATESSYGPGGQLLSRRTGDEVTSFTYDEAGRRTSEDGPGGRIDFTWGDYGWLTAVAGPQGHTDVVVDALGELARVDDADVFWDTARRATAPVQVGDEDIVRAPGFVGQAGQWHASGWRGVRADSIDGWSITPVAAASDGVGLGAAGELLVGGLEWLRHRVYDPQTLAFLSRDPLDSGLASGWAGNPYAYAGNDPLHALDPSGLKPLTDAELQTWIDTNCGNLWERHGMTIIGGLVTVAGVASMFLIPPPVGQIAGGVLFSVGTDLIQQGISGQPWDPWSTLIAFGTGFIPGSFGTSLVTRLVSGAGIGAATSVASTLTLGLIHGEMPSGGDLLTAGLWGAGTGTVSGGIDFLTSRPPTAPTPSLEPLPAPPGWTATDSGLLVPDAPNASPGGLVLPEAPTGFTVTDSGLYVPTAPSGTTPSPSGLYVPDAPSGYTTSPGGLYVPEGSGG